MGSPKCLISVTIVKSSANVRILNSSIYRIPCVMPFLFPISVSNRRNGFKKMLKSVGERTEPCWTPVSKVIPPPNPWLWTRLTVRLTVTLVWYRVENVFRVYIHPYKWVGGE